MASTMNDGFGTVGAESAGTSDNVGNTSDTPEEAARPIVGAAAPADAGARAPLPFVFTATGSGYFRIWIVNLLLTIVTVGIYSAWAKVRRLRYFYGNTTIDGSPFEFHGNPIAILKGRIVGVLLLAAYLWSPELSVSAWLVTVALLFALLPWLMWRSFRFRLANTSYRDIRFAFDGTLVQAYFVFIPFFLALAGPTLVGTYAEFAGWEQLGPPADVLIRLARLGLAFASWLLVPLFYFRLRVYQHRQARLGANAFDFDGDVSDAYSIALNMIPIGMAFLLGGGLASLIVYGLATLIFSNEFAAAIGIAFFYVAALTTFAITRAMIQNFVWGHSMLDGARFRSKVDRMRLWRIEVGNLALCFFTLGLYWPFAVVRSMRCRLDAMSWDGRADRLVFAAATDSVGAAGDETADLSGFDFAL